jgi:hypothetical protein
LPLLVSVFSCSLLLSYPHYLHSSTTKHAWIMSLCPKTGHAIAVEVGWAGIVVCSYSPYVIFHEKHTHMIQTYHIWKKGGEGVGKPLK